MELEELRARKKALGYSNKMIAELSGVPIGTVNKVFSGATAAPRYDTLRAIEDVLMERKYIKEKKGFAYNFPESDRSTLRVEESVLATFYDTTKKPGEYTVEDWFALPNDHRAELIEGYFYDMANPTLPHQSIISSLHLEFNRCAEEHPEKECMVFVSAVGVKLDPDNKTMVEPDLVIFCDPSLVRDLSCITGAPELLVEVLSPSNRDHDLIFKQGIYKKYGVKEYWIIDPKEESLLVYEFEKKDLPTSYTFDKTVPIGISDGECSIDFRKVRDRLHKLKSWAQR